MTETLIGYLQAAAALAPVWGFALIFFFMAVESSFIPFPSEVVMIPAGFLAYRGELTTGVPGLDLALAVLSGVVGSLAGAYVNYFLAMWLGDSVLRKYGKYFFIKPEALDRASAVFNKYGELTTFVCRLVPVIRQLISLPAGLAKMKLGSFTLFTVLGSGIWTAILGGIGWGLAHTAREMSYADLVHKGKAMLDANLIWILLGCAAVVVGYFLVERLVMGKRKAQ